MDDRMQKHRMRFWLGRLLPSLASAALLLFVMVSPASANFFTVGGTQTVDWPGVKVTVTVPANLTVVSVPGVPAVHQDSSLQNSTHIEVLSAGTVAVVWYQVRLCGNYPVMIDGIEHVCSDFNSHYLNMMVGVRTPWGSVPYAYFDFLLTEKRPDSLTITLSGGTEVEPSNGSDKKFLPIIATVIDENTKQPTTNAVQVHISLKVEDPKSGGHDHGDSTRPRGGIAEVETCATDSECWPGPQSTGSKGMTDGNGQVVFNFNAPEASGTHTISATCDGCTNTATKPVNVMVKEAQAGDLNPIPESSFYALKDSKGKIIGAIEKTHEDNHHLTAAAVAKLEKFARAYETETNPGKVLYLNDASLEWGGLYDVGSTKWKPPHKGHRHGREIDIRAAAAANGDPVKEGAIPFDLFFPVWKLAIEKGIKADLHCMENRQLVIGSSCYWLPEARHFHVNLN